MEVSKIINTLNKISCDSDYEIVRINNISFKHDFISFDYNDKRIKIYFGGALIAAIRCDEVISIGYLHKGD